MAFMKKFVDNVASVATSGSAAFTVNETNASVINTGKKLDSDHHHLYLMKERVMTSCILYIETPVKKAYSLFRLVNEKEARQSFNDVVSRFGPITQSSYQIYQSSKVLSEAWTVYRDHPHWTAAHIAANCSLSECFKHSSVIESTMDQDSELRQTPLHLAVLSNNADVVRELLSVQTVTADVADSNGNTALHLAAASVALTLTLILNKNKNVINHLNGKGETPLHIACSGGFNKNVEILLENGADMSITGTQSFPVHVAAQNSHNECIELLFKAQPEVINKQDFSEGGTPLHWTTDKTTISRLVGLGADINATNQKGETVLLNIVRKSSLDCVMELLLCQADPNICGGSDGTTPLLLALESDNIDLVRAMIVFGADVNGASKSGLTPRHYISVHSKGANKDVLLYTLHCVGAKRCPSGAIACRDGCKEDGSFDGKPQGPPILKKDAAKEFYADMISSTKMQVSRSVQDMARPAGNRGNSADKKKYSVAYDGANNGHGQAQANWSAASELSSAALTGSAASVSSDIGVSVLARESSSSLILDTEHVKNDRITGTKLLCLDGGGIRGLILVQILLNLEKYTKKPICELFDWIAGTSTGGILALALTYGCETGRDSAKRLHVAQSMYFRLKDEIFKGSRPYDDKLFEKLLQDEFGEDTVMTSVQHPKVMVTGSLVDRAPPDLHLFRNYTPPSDLFDSVAKKNASEKATAPDSIGDSPPSRKFHKPPPPSEQTIWGAGRSTGAAPTYFKALESFMDGGLIANNPTLDALTEIQEFNMALKAKHEEDKIENLGLVVSLGTGRNPILTIKNCDVFKPSGVIQMIDVVQGMQSLFKLVLEQATCSEGRVVDRCRAWCSMVGLPYFRVSPPLTSEIPLDTNDNSILLKMLWETEVYLFENKDKIQHIAQLLVS